MEEQIVPGKRLGRKVNHDERSRAYAFTAKVPINTVLHTRVSPVLDQGNVGSCTGNALVGVLGTSPFAATMGGGRLLDEAMAVMIYSAATLIDDADGSYPPNDTGSDGLSVAKVAKSNGLIAGYQHAFTLYDALVALQTYPVITGVNWYEGFDSPASDGTVHVTGQVRGGHEFEVIGVHAPSRTVVAMNSWGTDYGVGGAFRFSWADWERLLGEQGDVTVLLPLSVPAPNPTPPADATDATLAAVLHTWLDSTPWFYKRIQSAAGAWLHAKNL